MSYALKETSKLMSEKWPGSRITGDEGTKLLNHFTRIQDDKDLDYVNSKLKSKFNVFNPWMSQKDELFKFSILSENYSYNQFRLINDESGLLSRRELFSCGNSFNIKSIQPESTSETAVMPYNHSDRVKFVSMLEQSVKIITSRTDSLTSRFLFLINEIIPEVSENPSISLRENGSGLSTLYYRKGILLGMPTNKEVALFELSLNLAHEIGHQALMIYQLSDELIRDDHGTGIYSVIRLTKRPAILSLHAMMAVVYMLEFSFLRKEESLEIVCGSYFKSRVYELINLLRKALIELKSLNFTEFGEQIYFECASFLAWCELNYERL